MSRETVDTDFMDEMNVKQLVSIMNRLRISSSVKDFQHKLENDSQRKSFTTRKDLFQEEAKFQSLDSMYKNQLLRSRECNRDMMKLRKSLPIFDRKKDILNLIAENSIVIIEGETGCGKTTQIPQYILDDFIEKNKGRSCKILCTQPRRISTIAIAERIAKERGESCGRNQSVGYQIRMDSKLPRESGSMVFCTTGIVLQKLKTDPYLTSFSHIILDEVHERSLEIDFLIIVLRDLLRQRNDLKVILMSATMKTGLFSNYFNRCPVMVIQGRIYPVRKYMLEDVLKIIKFQPNRKSCINFSRDVAKVMSVFNQKRYALDLVIPLLQHICATDSEDAILIFLPGLEDINNLHYKLISSDMFSKPNYLIIMLHSTIPIENQQEVFKKSLPGIRKIVLATNIAETGITVEDVVYVIDCGIMKMSVFDQKRNVVNLVDCWISKCNARQREGRAGRIKPGVCYHLYNSYMESHLPDDHPPEIVRTRLENLCLRIKSMSFTDIRTVLRKAMDQPPPETVTLSIELLKSLNAFDDFENLTSLGIILSKLQLDPHLGKMFLYGAIFSCLSPITTIVAALDYKDPFYIPKRKQDEGNAVKVTFAGNDKSDHVILFRAFDQWEKAANKKQFCKENYLSFSIMQELSKLRKHLTNEIYNLGFIRKNDPKHSFANKNSENVELIKAVICAGLYPNIAFDIYEGRFTTCITKEHGSVAVHQKSILSLLPITHESCLVYYITMKTSRLFLYDATIIKPIVLYLFGEEIKFISDIAEESKESCSTIKQIRETLLAIIENVIKNNLCLDWEKDDPNVKFMKRVIDIINSED